MRTKAVYGVAVDIGATNLKVALGLKDGRILRKRTELTDTVTGPEAISLQIIRMISSLQLELGLTPEGLIGIGIGSIGPLDLKRGGIDRPANIPHYGFVPLVGPLSEEFKTRVELLNDCVAAVVGEKFFGEGRSEEDLVYITIGTGIGGGVYVNGRLLLGKDGNAHEIGHMVIDFEGKLICGCGKRGHWEAYCSGRNLPNYARLILEERRWNGFEGSLLYKYVKGRPEDITAKHLYDGAKAGDELCLDIVERVGRLNAIGFANVVNVYDPSLITVGGTVALRNEELVLRPIISYIGDYLINRPPIIKVTSLGESVTLYGALVAAFGLHKTQPHQEPSISLTSAQCHSDLRIGWQ